MKLLGIIPARGGSKGIPGKNVKTMAEEPLIAHTVRVARLCKIIDRLILSTDDKEIAKVGADLGVEIPFMRPAELSTDNAESQEVIRHALKFVISEGFNPDYVIVLQPTSPLREVDDVLRAVKLMEEGEFDQVISVTLVQQHPYWMKKLENNMVKPFIDTADVSLRRQDLPPLYIPNGAIYLYKRDYLLTPKKKPQVGAIIMEDWKSIDIDNPIDFFLAEKVMEAGKNGKRVWEI